jgi:plasmid stabilization system protein ParE
MTAYALHPEALGDIDEIRAYIAERNPDAADRMVTEIFEAVRALVPPCRVTAAPNLTSLASPSV